MKPWKTVYCLNSPVCSVTQWCPTLCNPMDCSPPGSSVLGTFPGRNTGVSSHALLQGIFPTQESNTCLLHCRQIFYRRTIRKAFILRLLDVFLGHRREGLLHASLQVKRRNKCAVFSAETSVNTNIYSFVYTYDLTNNLKIWPLGEVLPGTTIK